MQVCLRNTPQVTKTQPQQNQVCKKTCSYSSTVVDSHSTRSPFEWFCFLRSLSSTELVTTRSVHNPVTMPPREPLGLRWVREVDISGPPSVPLSPFPTLVLMWPLKDSEQLSQGENFGRQAKKKMEVENRWTRKSGLKVKSQNRQRNPESDSLPICYCDKCGLLKSQPQEPNENKRELRYWGMIISLETKNRCWYFQQHPTCKNAYFIFILLYRLITLTGFEIYPLTNHARNQQTMTMQKERRVCWWQQRPPVTVRRHWEEPSFLSTSMS